MSNSRQQVGDFLSVHARPTSRTAAAPVDTYAPPVVAPSRGAALANALSGLDSAFSPVLRKEIRQTAKRQFDEGQAAFDANRRDFAEAVRDGSIPMGASPFFRRGYRKSQLHVLGATYNVELERALEHSNLHEMSDPAEVETFIQAFGERFGEENNIAGLPPKEVAAYYQPLTQQANDGFRRAQASRNIEFVEEQRFRAFQNEVHLAISAGHFTGPPGSASASASNLGDWLNARSQEMYEQGIDYKLIEKHILSAVGEGAAQNGSMGALSVLNRVNITGVPLSQTEGGRSVRQRVGNAIAAQEAARNRAAEKAERDAISKNAKALRGEAQSAAMAGDYERAEELALQANSIDPVQGASALNFVRTRQGDGEDTARTENFTATVAEIRGAGSATEAQAILDEKITFGDLSTSDYNALSSLADSFHGEGPTADLLGMAEGDSVVKGVLTTIDRTVGESPYGLDKGTYADAASRAKNEAVEMAIEWIRIHADEDGNYNRLDLRNFMNTQLPGIQSRYQIDSPTAPTGSD